jgi:hypothetical protein
MTINEVLKPVFDDSFGGVMYNVANRDKYDNEAIFEVWDSMSPAEQEASGGLVQGAINFLKGN